MTTTKTKERTFKTIEVAKSGTISKKFIKDFENKYGAHSAEREYDVKFDGSFKHNAITKTTKKRAVKGTSDFIPYDDATRIGNDILWHGRQPVNGFYIIFSINAGLRVGDVLKLRHADLIGKKPGEYLLITEQKTKKVRQVQLNDKIIDAYNYLHKRSRVKATDFIFMSQKNHVFATVTINRTLKRVFKGIAPVISSHSLRKSFGRRVYEMNGRSEHALVLLSDIFGHSSLTITRRYLGLRREEIANVYLTL
jgi:integrase